MLTSPSSGNVLSTCRLNPAVYQAYQATIRLYESPLQSTGFAGNSPVAASVIDS